MSSNLRQRHRARLEEPEMSLPEPSPKNTGSMKKAGCPVNLNKGWKGWMRKAVVILVPAYTLSVMFEVLDPPKPLVLHAWDDFRSAMSSGERVYSEGELRMLSSGTRPMLSILGEVFDVSKGEKHYGRKGAYRGFTGRDASRAFVTGDFTDEGLTDDVSMLEPSQCLGLKGWLEFYHKEADKYIRKGVLKGRFYDKNGNATPTLRAFERCVHKGRKDKEREEAEKKLYPNCNSRWSAAEGGRVWCEESAKVPRKIPAKAVHGADVRYSGKKGSGANPRGGKAHAHAGSHGGEHPAGNEQALEGEEIKDAVKAKGRCACFEPGYAQANEERLLSYGGCAPDSNSCDTRPPEPPRKK